MAIPHQNALNARVEPWTVDELLTWPEDGTRHELYDGELHVSPFPHRRHALAVLRLRALLTPPLPPGAVLFENVGVEFNSLRLLGPDLVVAAAAAAVSTERYLSPSEVLLAAEIESPSSRILDRTAKPAMYAEGGIPIYLRIALSGPEVHLYVLVDGIYRVTSFGPGEPVSLPAPISITFDPALLAGSAE